MEILKLTDIKQAAKIIDDERVLAFPTETVYGVGVVFDSKLAFDRLVTIKRRPPNKPFALMCSTLEQAFEYIQISERAKKVMRNFLPGEVTFLVRAREELPYHVTLGTKIIGIRVSQSQFVECLIKEVGKPLLVTSANKSGEPTTRFFEDVVKTYGEELPAIVKGECESLIPTTIVNLVEDDTITLVREGPVPFEKIKTLWEETK